MGPIGVQGATGASGPKGDIGATGPQGANGSITTIAIGSQYNVADPLNPIAQVVNVVNASTLVIGSVLILASPDGTKQSHARLTNATPTSITVSSLAFPGDQPINTNFPAGTIVGIAGEQGSPGNSVFKFFSSAAGDMIRDPRTTASFVGVYGLGDTPFALLNNNSYVGTASGIGIHVTGEVILNAQGLTSQATARVQVTIGGVNTPTVIYDQTLSGKVDPQWTETVSIDGFYTYLGAADAVAPKTAQILINMDVTPNADNTPANANQLPTQAQLMLTEYY